MKRPLSLRQQLIFALVVPAFLVVGAMAYRAEAAMQRALEEALGQRLEAIALAAATTTDPRVLLLEAGDDESRIAKNARKKLDTLLRATRLARIVVARLDDSTVLLDSAGKLKVGDELARALFDKSELERVAGGQSASSVLFQDEARRWSKSGFAPIAEPGTEEAPGAVKGVVIVEAPAELFTTLAGLRSVVLTILLVGFGALIVLATIAARGVTNSLSRLSSAAERIGAGQPATEIPVGGPKEAQVLAETMRAMARSISLREEEMQVMLAGIAHEVRNPLGGIELFGGLLREDLVDDPRQKHVDKILREINVLGGVVTDFLDYARKRPLDRRKLELGELLEDVAQISRTEAQAKEIQILVDTEPGLAAAIDHDTIRRALLNLLKNAIQATPAKGTVTLRGASAGSSVVLEVADNGPGIPAEKREEVFRPFFTTKQKGTGLGLALVKKAADAHQGGVAISETPGGGATFTLTLPKA